MASLLAAFTAGPANGITPLSDPAPFVRISDPATRGVLDGGVSRVPLLADPHDFSADSAWIAGANQFQPRTTWIGFANLEVPDRVTIDGDEVTLHSWDDSTSDRIELFLFQEFGAGPVGSPTANELFEAGDVIVFRGEASATRTGNDPSNMIVRAFVKMLGFNELGWQFQLKPDQSAFHDIGPASEPFELSVTFPDLEADDSFQVLQVGFEITTEFDGADMDSGTITFSDLDAFIERAGGQELVILSHPADTTVAEDGEAVFTVTADGPAETVFRWQSSFDGGETFSSLADGAFFGATLSGALTDTLTISETPLMLDGMIFRLRATAGDLVVFSDPATLGVGATYTVTFDLGERGTRVCGGDLVQTVARGGAAVAPEVEADAGWTFMGWDGAFDNITADTTVAAVYEEIGGAITIDLLERPHDFSANSAWIAGANQFQPRTEWIGFAILDVPDRVTIDGDEVTLHSWDDSTSDRIELFLFQEFGAGPAGSPTANELFEAGDVIVFRGEASATRTGNDPSNMIVRAFVRMLGFNELGWEFQLKPDQSAFHDIGPASEPFELSVTFPDLEADDSFQVLQVGFEITTEFDGADMDSGTITFSDLDAFIERENGQGLATLDEWLDAVGVPVGLRGPTDRHGPLQLTNLEAYGMGLPPFEATAADLPRMERGDDGSGVLRFHYRVNTRARDVATYMEASADLIAWTAAEPLEDNPVWETDGVQGREAVFEAAESLFVRLRVGEPEDTPISQNLSANGYRLPLEAEWEFAAPGGNATNGHSYAGSNDLNEVGW